MKTIEQLRAEGWGNCTNRTCGYFFKREMLPACPMCRHLWRNPPPYEQPPYESPSLN